MTRVLVLILVLEGQVLVLVGQVLVLVLVLVALVLATSLRDSKLAGQQCGQAVMLLKNAFYFYFSCVCL